MSEKLTRHITNNYRLMAMTVAMTLSAGVMAQSASMLPELQRLSLPTLESALADYEANPASISGMCIGTASHSRRSLSIST